MMRCFVNRYDRNNKVVASKRSWKLCCVTKRRELVYIIEVCPYEFE